MNKNYPTFFFTWFNKLSQVPFLGIHFKLAHVWPWYTMLVLGYIYVSQQWTWLLNCLGDHKVVDFFKSQSHQYLIYVVVDTPLTRRRSWVMMHRLTIGIKQKESTNLICRFYVVERFEIWVPEMHIGPIGTLQSCASCSCFLYFFLPTNENILSLPQIKKWMKICAYSIFISILSF